MTDDELLAEAQRRMDQDAGIRYPLDDVLRAFGITREELEEV